MYDIQGKERENRGIVHLILTGPILSEQIPLYIQDIFKIVTACLGVVITTVYIRNRNGHLTTSGGTRGGGVVLCHGANPRKLRHYSL